MVSENRVKLMTRMALYESKQGQEDLKISEYYRKDYASFYTIIALLWATLGYATLVAVAGIAFIDNIMKHFTMSLILMLLIGVVVGYVILLLVFGAVIHSYYQKKHNQARHNVKKYNRDLTHLLKMQKRESL